MKLVILLVFAISLLLSDAATQTTQQQQYNARSSRRERNLDHWDATALAFVGTNRSYADVVRGTTGKSSNMTDAVHQPTVSGKW